MKRPSKCNCRCGCDLSPKTLKAFDKTTGGLRWHHWLDNPVLSSDGHIYGYAYEEDDSAEAMACTMAVLSGAGSPAILRIAAGPAIRYKKWVRKIDADGAIVGDSDFFWYTGNIGYTDTPIHLPNNFAGWAPDLFGASTAGEIVQMTGDYSVGTTLLDKIIVWDDNNTTTTRKYTIVAAAVRNTNPAALPSGAQMRFIAEFDGTNAEQTINVPNMIGKTAADLATALSAFPHITSVTGTGGPYPLKNIDLTIVWDQSTTHFKTVHRVAGTSRGVITFIRDWDTAEVTATLAQSSPDNTCETLWQFDGSDNIIGAGGNPFTIVNGTAGNGISKWTRSGTAYTQLWRVKPTLDRPAKDGPGGVGADSRILYKRPAIRGGVIVVSHSTGQGSDQPNGADSNWRELNAATGANVSNGTQNNRLSNRATFATSSKLYVTGHDSFLVSFTGSTYQCGRAWPNYATLTSALSGPAADYFGDYGPTQTGVLGTDANSQSDGTAIYSSSGALAGTVGGSFSHDAQVAYDLIAAQAMAILPAESLGWASRVAADGYFSFAPYYRVTNSFANAINIRWASDAQQWRVSFYNHPDFIDNDHLITSTAWLDFHDDEVDLEVALLAVLGNNDWGPNIWVEGPVFPATAAEPLPTMVWQRGITLVTPAEKPNFPPTVPPIPHNLSNRDNVRTIRIQVKGDPTNVFAMSPGNVSRMDWATGDRIWDVPFGRSITGGAEIGGVSGILNGENYIVAGNRVDGGCICSWRWEGYTPDWVLIFADCGIKTATPPATAGTFLGEVREGTCR